MKDENKKNLYIFLVIAFIFILLMVFILPKYLYGRSLLSYYIQPTLKYGSLYGKFDNTFLMSDTLNNKFITGRFLSFFILIFFLLFVWWTKKNIKYNRKIIYPVMYLIFLILIYFLYLPYVRTWIGNSSSDVLIAPVNNIFLSNLLFRILLVPINPLNFMFIILVKLGDMVDANFKSKKYIPFMKIFYLGSLIFLVQFLICIVVSFIYFR